MCIESMEKLDNILENPPNSPQGLRRLLREINLCSACRYQDKPKVGVKLSGCLVYHQMQFRNRLYHIAEELEISKDSSCRLG